MPYTALGNLAAPGTLVYGYRRGDEVPDSVVENWGLTIGENGDVIDGPLDAVDTPVGGAPVRPGVEDNRSTWEAWGIANGMTPEEADAASQEDLEAAGPQEHGAVADQTEVDHPRPADSAKKSEWVLYVNDHPQATAEDQAWAGDDSTTKADLQGWQPGASEPEVGDPVAVEATERANG